MKTRLLLLLVTSLGFLRAADSAFKPNVIVILTDDLGWADIGSQGINKDIRTPNLDALAAGGLRATSGYVTAPQCVPSRAGLLTGRYQPRFGVESNGSELNGFDTQQTIASRLKKAGYATGMTGKWHLGPVNKITTHGFDDVYCNQGAPGKCWANFDLDGKTITGAEVGSPLYHLDANSDAACAFIKRHKDGPFFFYLAYRAPHTPLDAPEKYTARFPGPMPERRRQCLAMMSAVDDGVGRVMTTLREFNLETNTLVFFMSDNGAPLKIHKTDSPLNGDAGGWDGSLNWPMNGEKGMLSEGGMREPWIAHWKDHIPAGQVYAQPVISLDVAATAVALAGLPGDVALDGVNLIPYFTGENKAAPHDRLFWRWEAQAAIREGKWKLLVGGPRSYLFDLESDREEKHSVLAQHPEIGKQLRARLEAWAAELQPPGINLRPMAKTWEEYYDFYLDGKPAPAGAPASGGKGQRKNARAEPEGSVQGWLCRNGTIAVKDGALMMTPAPGTKKAAPFLTHAALDIPGPVTVTLRVRASQGGAGTLAWRTTEQKDFTAGNTASFDWPAGPDWREVKVDLPVKSRLVHLRIQPPPGGTEFVVQSATLAPAEGKPIVFDFTKASNPP